MIHRMIFKTALRMVCKEEIAMLDALPLIEAERSENYLNAIDSLKKQSRATARVLSRRKIVAIIAAAVLVALSITACVYRKEIVALKDKLYEVLFEEHEDHITINKEKTPLDKIEEFYEPTWLPERFEELEPIRTDSLVSLEWECETGGIIFEQSLLNDGFVNIDKEGFDFIEKKIGDRIIYYGYKESHQAHIAFWKNEYYLFFLNGGGEITYDEIEKIIANIKLIDF